MRTNILLYNTYTSLSMQNTPSFYVFFTWNSIISGICVKQTENGYFGNYQKQIIK